MNFEEIKESLEFLDDWEDRYKFVIDIGGDLEPMAEVDKNAATKVEGCVSQVWIKLEDTSNDTFILKGDSDAMIVKGLVAIVIALFSGKTAQEMSDTPALSILKEIGLNEHLTSQRANGLRSMIDRVYAEANARL